MATNAMVARFAKNFSLAKSPAQPETAAEGKAME